MEQEIVKSQHYVPVFYLKNFVNSSGKLYVYDRKENELFLCMPQKICQSKFLYETPWEDTKVDRGKYVLCNTIENSFSACEGRYSTVVKRLLNICVPSQNPHALICSHKDKEELISFTVNLFVRNPWAMDYFEMDTIPKELDEHPVSNAVRKLLEELNWGGANSLIKHSIKCADLLEHDEGGLVRELKQEIAKLNFTFYYSKSGKFITSSCPSCLGYFKNGKVFAYLPLSPYVAVSFGDSIVSREDNNRMGVINTDDTMGVNRIYLSLDTKRVRYFIGNSDVTLQEYLS